MAEGHSEGEGAGGGCAPSCAKRESQIYFQFMKAKNNILLHNYELVSFL